MILLFQLFVILVLLCFISLLLYSMILGAPYAPIGEQKIEAMLSLLNVKPGENAVDIGSGDGRIVIALAKKGAIAHGYEINPLLVIIALYKIRKEKLQNKAYIHWASFWQKDFSSFDIITIYLTGHIMKKVETKILKEAKKEARIAVNYFGFPDSKPVKQKNTIYLYTK